MTNVVEMKKKVNPINEVKFAEHDIIKFVAYPVHGETLEDVLESGYWSYVAERFTPMVTEIRVIAEDSSWMADLLVMSCERNWANVRVLNHYDFSKEKKAAKKSSEFKVEFVPAHKWRFKNKASGEVIQKGFQTKDEANKALRDYENLIKR